jgi:hypothetical protein
VRLAIGRHFSDCTPVKGTYKGSSEHTLEVSVSIENGQLKKDEEEKRMTPVFSYKSKNPATQTNSYRRYLENAATTAAMIKCPEASIVFFLNKCGCQRQQLYKQQD